MVSPLDMPLLPAFALIHLTGLSVNLLILAVKCMEWRQNIDLNACDVIIASLGGCNLLLQCATFAKQFFFTYWYKTFSDGRVALPFLVTGYALFSCSIWFSTWLSVYYCLKIGNSKQSIFLWLEVRFHKVVPWLLLGSVIESVAISLPLIWDLEIPFPANQTSYAPRIMSRCSCIYQFHVAVHFLALTICCCAAVAILLSLWRHVRRMQQNAESFRSAQLGAHLGAVKTVTALLILYVASSILLTLTVVLHQIEDSKSAALINAILYSALPSVNGFILIMGNTRLKKAVCVFILCGKCGETEGA
ncbi:taste receptor type 2 member 7-like [Ambystoma mexicanum]|uniref:taste receptor type 2 member 7-like n=1 Tax=Ambystoma mexicanum TaxID=8296 RepID=UPI0037E9727F